MNSETPQANRWHCLPPAHGDGPWCPNTNILKEYHHNRVHYNAFAVCLNLLVLGLAMRGTWLITHCYDTPETLRFSSYVRQRLILQLNICDLLLSVVNLMPWCLGKENRVASGTLLEFAEDLPQRPQLKWSDLSTDDVEHGSRCQASIFTTSM